MKYLIVDDSKFARNFLLNTLLKELPEAQTFQATNGQEALDMIKNEDIGIVFLDLTMPIMDGHEALHLMMKAKPELKVIVQSADVQIKAKEHSISLGAKLHVKKPINGDKIKEILGAI